MNEALLESAQLYALGLLTDGQQRAFEQELRLSRPLQRELHNFQEATLVLAQSAPQIAPPADLRAQLLEAFRALPAGQSKTTTNNVVAFPSPASAKSQSGLPQPPSSSRLLPFIPWAAVAAISFLFFQNKDAINTAQQELNAAKNEAVTARERDKHFLEAVRLSEAAKAQSDATLTGIRRQLANSEAALSRMDQERETLEMELAVLRDDSQLDKTRIAVLGSLLKDQPQAVAVSLWRQQSQDGLLVVENMPALPPGRDYQLWVIDPNLKTPVSAGVFKVDAEGKVRLEFKPTRNVQSAYKFAVTMEKEGGAMVPTMDQMMVIGG